MGAVSASPALGTSFQFGRFVLDVAARELRAGGARISLGARAFDVLVVLVENRDRLVTKDELFERVWPGLVVEENNLQVQISALRKALGQQSIATIPGRGYRFSVSLHGEPPAKEKRRSWLVVAGATGFAIAIAGIWSLIGGGFRPESKPSSIDAKSIVVLPFVDMSEKHDQEYFSDGLTEELIDHLNHAPDLKVIARTSSFQFKSKNEDTRLIAGRLGVAHLLEGSVRKSGGRLRITAQLIRAQDGVHLWSQTYDRTFKDIFQVQEEIAATVAQQLRVVLKVASADDQPNAEAYRLRLEGDFFFNRHTRPDLEKAMGLYKSAIALDPKYALAWANLGTGYIAFAVALLPESTSVSENLSKAREALDHALRIDPNLAKAHLARGWIAQNLTWDWGTAQAEYRRAIDLDPGLETTDTDLVWIFGRLDESIATTRHSLVRDPLSTRKLNHLALLLFWKGHYEGAADNYRKVSELNPSYAGAKAFLAATLLYQGKKAEALLAAQQEPDESWKFAILPIIYWDLARHGDSDAVLRQLESKYAEGMAYNIAQVHAYRGEVGAAFEWLEKAYRQRDSGMTLLKVDPMLSNLRADSRYRALLVKMKLDGDGHDFIGETKRRP